MVYNQTIQIYTKGFCDVVDITSKVVEIVQGSEIKDGLAVVFISGSTAAITTIETNANLEQDLAEALAIIAPENKSYEHDEGVEEGNGFSHIRASLIGPSLAVPIISGELQLGTWQKIVCCDFDNQERKREIIVQVTGE